MAYKRNPFTKRYGRFGRGFGYRRRRRKMNQTNNKFAGKSTTGIIRNPVGTQDRQLVKIKFNQTGLVTSTTHFVSAIFRLNSAYDPRYASGGGQPAVFDQWATMYQKYLVYGSKARAIFVNEGTSKSAWCGFFPSSSTATTHNLDDVINYPYAKYKCALMNNTNGPTVTAYYSIRKLCGLNDLEPGENVYTANVGADPAQAFYLHVGACSADESTSTAVRYHLEMTMYTMFFLRKDIADA